MLNRQSTVKIYNAIVTLGVMRYGKTWKDSIDTMIRDIDRDSYAPSWMTAYGVLAAQGRFLVGPRGIETLTAACEGN